MRLAPKVLKKICLNSAHIQMIFCNIQSNHYHNKKIETCWKITATMISNHKKITIDSMMFMSSFNNTLTNAQKTST